MGSPGWVRRGSCWQLEESGAIGVLRLRIVSEGVKGIGGESYTRSFNDRGQSQIPSEEPE
jgi:hypothetical protein